MNKTYLVLIHHGIKGQRWGVRRYQNEDGSLTSAGKKRYLKDSNGISHRDVISKDEILELASESAFTIEGLICKSDSDRKMLVNFMEKNGIDVKNIAINNISGNLMNKSFNLTGDNAYNNDFHIVALSGLKHDSKLSTLKSATGSRWMDDIIENNSNNEKSISHHGIKGQRWGVRRFQNENGTLTTAGKRRYGNPKEHGNSIDNKEGKKILESDYKRADAEASKAILEGTSKSLNSAGDLVDNIGKRKSKVINKADYSKMSDQELRDRINRINMERKYGELTGDTKLVRSGQDWTREILQTAGAVAGIGASIAGTIWTIRQIKLNKSAKGGT